MVINYSYNYNQLPEDKSGATSWNAMLYWTWILPNIIMVYFWL